jgi:hypothetical protein
MSGNQVSLAVGALVAVGGAVLVLVRLPTRPSEMPQSGVEQHEVSLEPDPSRLDGTISSDQIGVG